MRSELCVHCCYRAVELGQRSCSDQHCKAMARRRARSVVLESVMLLMGLGVIASTLGLGLVAMLIRSGVL